MTSGVDGRFERIPHTEAWLRNLYVTLKAETEAAGVWVVEQGRVAPGEERRAGQYEPPQLPDGSDGYRIVIFRVSDTVPGPAEDELITLAHEIGHDRSRRAGLRLATFHDVATRFDCGAPLDDAEREQILADERYAWVFAREVLAARGFADWSRFEGAEGAALIACGEQLSELPEKLGR